MVYPADNTRLGSPNNRSAAIAAAAQHFADLRRYLARTPDQIAYRLHTDASVVLALETGAFHLLPPRAERHRIIMAYAALADLHGQPIWTCVESLITPPAPFQSPLSPPLSAPPPAATFYPKPTADELPPPAPITHWQAIEQSARQPSLMSRAKTAAYSVPDNMSSFTPNLARIGKFSARTSWRTGIAVAVIAAIAITSQTSILQAGVNKLPSPVSRLVWGATDAVMLQFVKRFEGLPWIDPADPRSRRGDKLKVAKQAKR